MYSGNFWLSRPQMTVNAQYILDYLFARGWTKNAICGMLGNMETESTINPGIWQNLDAGNLSLGYGLVQWTPAPKYLDWCTARGYLPSSMNSALLRILEEVETDSQWGNDAEGNPPPFTFEEFTQSELPAGLLAMFFLRYYERPGDVNQPNRATQAEEWFNTLVGTVPKKKSKLWFYLSKRRIVIK